MNCHVFRMDSCILRVFESRGKLSALFVFSPERRTNNVVVVKMNVVVVNFGRNSLTAILFHVLVL